MKLVRIHSVRRTVKRFVYDCLQCRIKTVIISLLLIGVLVIIYVAARPSKEKHSILRSNEMRLVHLDLKGAPPKVSYLKQLFPLFAKWGATGLLIEYEDTFPYQRELEILRSKNVYTEHDIQEILSAALYNHLEVMPLVQTFGHFEFVLKHDKFRYLRELDPYPNALCPSNSDSMKLLHIMIDQVMRLHPDIRFFHIGSDEVWHLAKCAKCQDRMRSGAINKEDIFINHVYNVARYIKDQHHVQPVMWDDMFRHFTIKELRDSKMALVVEPMIWQYTPDLDQKLPQTLFSRYSEVFDNVWAASSFKGATGPSEVLTDTRYHLSNHKKWLSVMSHQAGQFKVFRGFVLTGWQRYDHYAVLCELLPVAIPSLAINLQTLTNGEFSEHIHRSVSSDLGLHAPELLELSLAKSGSHSQPQADQVTFPGSEVYRDVHMLHRLRKKLVKFFDSHDVKGWLNPHLILHNFTNPFRFERDIKRGLMLYSNYQQLVLDLKQSMSDIYDSDTVEEFYEEHIAGDLDKLHTLLKQAEQQLAIGAHVKDYLKHP